nr:hypothetical protein [Lachnospiraceae bacterium]
KAARIADRTYTGRPIKLTARELRSLLYTTDKKTKEKTYLVPGTDFEVLGYSGNTKAGKASVTLKGKGSCGGIRTLTFRIRPAKRSIIDILFGKR